MLCQRGHQRLELEVIVWLHTLLSHAHIGLGWTYGWLDGFTHVGSSAFGKAKGCSCWQGIEDEVQGQATKGAGLAFPV